VNFGPELKNKHNFENKFIKTEKKAKMFDEI